MTGMYGIMSYGDSLKGFVLTSGTLNQNLAIQQKISTIKTSSRGWVATTLSILGASAVLTITNLSPAHADTNNYAGHTVDIETSGDRWSRIDYPWDGLDPQTQIYGGRNGSATTADFTAQSDVKELGLFADVGKKLKGLGFVRHGTGGFFYLKSNPSLAAVKVDNEGRLCLISRKDNKAFHSLDFDDLMQKCRELNALHNGGQEAVAINPNASRSITARLNLNNPTIRRIISDQDANINHIVEITQQYSQEGSLDKIAEQSNRLRRLASKLKNPDSLFSLNITNTSVYGSVEGQPNYGTIGANFGKDPVTTVYGDYKRATSLDKTTRRLLARRFEKELVKVQGLLNYYISHPEAKDFSIRYILANFIAQGGVLPEGVIGGGEGAVSREIEGGRARTIEEPIAREERPVETKRTVELPCGAQLPLSERLAALRVKSVMGQRVKGRPLITFLASSERDSFGLEAAIPPCIDVERASQITDEQKQHILEGDSHGGGHGYGRGIRGKTEFPARWTDEQAMDYIRDVVKDSRLDWFQQRDGRWRVEGIRDRITIRVIVERNGSDIVTAFPVGIPRNP